jgi:Domain of unknown function (DUF4365)
MSSLSSTKQLEEYSIAFVHAAVACAGFAFEFRRIDDDSVDCSIRSRSSNGAWSRPQIDLQLKCTGTPDFGPNGDLRFPLSVKNYNDLRPSTDDIRIPRLLVVVVVPPEPTHWITDEDDHSALHRSGYWVSLAGRRQTSNVSSVTVDIPKVNRWTPLAVATLMEEAENDRL